jgi:hypothetical protein
MDRGITRRKLLAGGAAAAGALAIPSRLLAAPKTADIYRLETGCGSGACACPACFLHDTHSYFPSWKAANGNRAHIGCNCVIRKGSIDYGTPWRSSGIPST